MIDNRIQAKISIRKVKGILTTPGGDSQLKGDKRRNGREEGHTAIDICIGTASPYKQIYMCWSRFDCMSW